MSRAFVATQVVVTLLLLAIGVSGFSHGNAPSPSTHSHPPPPPPGVDPAPAVGPVPSDPSGGAFPGGFPAPDGVNTTGVDYTVYNDTAAGYPGGYLPSNYTAGDYSEYMSTLNDTSGYPGGYPDGYPGGDHSSGSCPKDDELSGIVFGIVSGCMLNYATITPLDCQGYVSNPQCISAIQAKHTLDACDESYIQQTIPEYGLID